VVFLGERLRLISVTFRLFSCSTVEGDTSTFECAHQLGKLCENRHLVVNLIPYNQTDVKDKLRCPSEAHMRKFQMIVASYGAFSTIRRTMGADIASACGQLVVKKEKEAEMDVDIEDGPFIKGSDKDEVDAVDRNNGASSMKSAADAQAGDNDDISKWVKPLAIATSVAASCFVASGILFLSQGRRR